MPQPNDLSRSLVALDQNSTIIAVIEMSQSSWLVAGVLPPERRPGSEYLAWSAVRGLAMLFTEGPLRRLTSAERDVIGQRLLDMVEKGL